MTDWQVGDLAECIESEWAQGGVTVTWPHPKFGSIYMVQDMMVQPCPNCQRDHLYLQLVGFGSDGWNAEGFRKVQPRGEDQKVKRREEVDA